MTTVMRHQFGHLLRSMQTWVVLALAAVAIGYVFLSQLEQWMTHQASIAASDHAPGLTGFLSVRYLEPLSLLFSLLAPLLAMRSFSEEFREQSHVLWQVAPLSTRALVLGKFFGILAILLIPLCLSVVLIALLSTHTSLEFSVLASAFLGLLLCTAACAAIGLFFSSLTRHAMVAMISAVAVVLLLWLVGSSGFAQLPLAWLNLFSIPDHLGGFFQGYLQSRGLVFFLTLTVLFLALTTVRLDALRLQGN